MNTKLFLQLGEYLNREITVAVGEELITGTLESVNTDFLILTESTEHYERESRTRIIIFSQISFVQVAEQLA
ncbi:MULTISPECIES: hypothetical protein [Solibacillus]|uniref:DUF2642 domain-containing protein n=1 Tax=Solibacillus merdavium TaxID=2762218 RepID=A0ABR8XIA9_9BACL|nr:hypothetical protein [Solibacillus merdavium]MBD8031672.1 hypothetical protein [Solibacillus merdavium]